MVVLSISLCVMNLCWGESPPNAMPVIQFSIKPRVCILSEGERVCEDELQLLWQSERPRSLCLYKEDAQTMDERVRTPRDPLQCWSNARFGEHYIQISASRNVSFQLREQVSENVLVTEAFEVVQDQPQFRRRRRNAWSFF